MLQPQVLRVQSFDGAHLYTEIFSAENPTLDVIFVHGLTGDTTAFQWVIAALLDPRVNLPIRCITFDLRAHGYSDRFFPPDATSLVETYAKDILAVVETVAKNPFILAGQSLFGIVVQEYLSLPNRPEPAAVVPISPVINSPNVMINNRWWFSQLKKFSQHWQPNTKKRTPEDHLRFRGSFDYSPGRIYSDIYFTGFFAYLLLWGSLLGTQAPQLSKLNHPAVYFIYGLKDLLVPFFVQRASLKKIPLALPFPINGNHNSIVNSPQLVTPILIQACHECLAVTANETTPEQAPPTRS